MSNVDTTQTTHLSLCSGYGGIDIGLKRVLPDVRTIAYVEIEAFSCANLVEKMESQQLDAAPIWSNLKTFNAKPFRGKVDILSGGFPCLPFSHAGQRKGTEDPRHLFPHIERIIRDCEPSIIFLENVEGIISAKYQGEPDTSVLQYVLERLEKMGCRATAGLFSAEECHLPHRRKRAFILGISNNDCQRLEEPRRHDTDGCCSGELGDSKHDGLHSKKRDATESCSNQQENRILERTGSGRDKFPARPKQPQHPWEYPRTISNEEVITALGGATYGIANGSMVHSCRVDALRLLGNGVVPATCEKAFVTLMDRLNELADA